LITAEHRPFFCRPTFFPSPPKPFELPSYAEGMALHLARDGLRNPPLRSRSISSRVLQFLDVEAVQFDGVESSDSPSHDNDSDSTSSTSS